MGAVSVSPRSEFAEPFEIISGGEVAKATAARNELTDGELDHRWTAIARQLGQRITDSRVRPRRRRPGRSSTRGFEIRTLVETMGPEPTTAYLQRSATSEPRPGPMPPELDEFGATCGR